MFEGNSMKTKVCKHPECKIKTEQPLENFYKSCHSKDGLYSWCKSCWNIYVVSKRMKKYYSDPKFKQKILDEAILYIRNRKEKDPLYRRKTITTVTNCMRKQRCGITSKQYDQMFKDQNGVCVICGKPETITHKGTLKRLCIDHDHITGKVRRLLCHNCNCAIGLLDDNPERIIAAANYILQYRTSSLEYV